MRVIYLFFLFTLFWSYWKALVRLRHKQFPLTPILGWMVGIGYFMLAPLTVLVFNGGYTIPAFYDVNEQYSSVDLSTGRYVIPMLVIWLALLLSFLVVVLLTPKPEFPGFYGGIHVDDWKLKRILLLTLALSVIDYLAMIKIYGGLESFLVSHWYRRQEEMVSQLGDIFVLYARVSLANQILFTSSAAINFARQVQRRKLDWGFSVLIVFALLLQMVMSGNRIFIALFGLAFLTSCWVYNRKRLIATLLIASPALLLLFSAWAYLRHDLTTIAEDIPTYAQQDLGNRITTTLVDT